MKQHQRSNEQVRRSNLSSVLRALHYDGPQSRAALTRRTGVYRSTIAALVSELVDLSLVSEALPEGREGVGRPSPIVSINSNVVAIAAYPDVDSVVVGIVGLGGIVHKRVRRSLPVCPTPEEAVEAIAGITESLQPELQQFDRIVGLGAGVPALVDSVAGVVALAPNLKWSDVPFGEMLRQRTGFDSFVVNDAQAGASTERQFGPGRGVDHMVYLNGSGEGIGGGAYVDGREVRGYRGFGAEFGHIVINPSGEQCYCGQRGCLEREVRQRSLLRLIAASDQRNAAQGSDGGTAVSLDADELEQELLMNQSTALAAEIDRQVDRLGDGIAALTSVLAPQLVVLGGFLSMLLKARPERLTHRIHTNSFGRVAEGMRVVSGGFGAHEVLVGVSEHVFSRVFDDPALFAGSGE